MGCAVVAGFVVAAVDAALAAALAFALVVDADLDFVVVDFVAGVVAVWAKSAAVNVNPMRSVRMRAPGK
jgi:hypothetical protein